MLVDTETSGRCVLATLDVLGQEVDRLTLAADQGRRVTALIRIARGHAAELLGGDLSPDAPSAPDSRPPAGVICRDAATAWEHAAALRRSTSPEEIAFHAAWLMSIASSAPNALVRRMCRQAVYPSPTQ
ncbi:MAG: hypothetical protein ACAH22_14360 [Tardiphaga sp.]